MNSDSVLLLGLGAVVVYLLSQSQQTAQTVKTSSGNTAVTVTPPQPVVVTREVVTRVPVMRMMPVTRQPAPAATLPPVVRPPVVRGRVVAL